MVKRHADGVLVAACASSCLDVLPSQLHRAADQPVLSAIENLPTTFNQDTSRFGCNKKQCRLISDQGPKPFEASSLFAQARAVLRQPASAVHDAPIGREQEFEALTQAVNDFRSSGSGSCVYVSGLPGTGKSHTVRKTLTHFLSSSSSSSSSSSAQPQCLVTWINCMSVSSVGEVYAQVAATARAGHSNNWQQQQQQHPQQEQRTNDDPDDLPLFDNQQQQPQQHSLSYDALLDTLQQQHKRSSASSKSSSSRGTKRYRATRGSTATDAKLSSRSSSPSSSDNDNSQPQQPPPHIVVLDEIDNIAKKSLPDLVQLFKLPHEPGVSVLVVGIANSIDLTERTLPELKLQLVTPRLITFNAYSAKQLGAILEGVMRQLPSQLFSPPALQLVCRSVGASSGDLRHALKACRAAIDELEQQHLQQTEAAITSALADSFDSPAPAAPTPASLTVGPKQMSMALARLAGVRSAQFGAQAASIVRSLPNQQQMLLYSLAVLCKQPEEGAAAAGAQDPVTPSKGSKAAASSLWKGAGSAAVLSCSGAGAGSPAGAGGSWSGLKKKKKAAVGGSGSQAGPKGCVFVLAVTADAAYHQYSQVCKLLKLPACSKGELLHMADLLAQMALLDIIKTPSGPAGSSTGSKSAFKGSGSAAGGLKGFKGSASKLGGLGGSGRGLLSGASRGGLGGLSGSPMGSAANAAQQGEVKLSLRASSSEVFGALKHNPALRCLVDA